MNPSTSLDEFLRDVRTLCRLDKEKNMTVKWVDEEGEIYLCFENEQHTQSQTLPGIIWYLGSCAIHVVWDLRLVNNFLSRMHEHWTKSVSERNYVCQRTFIRQVKIWRAESPLCQVSCVPLLPQSSLLHNICSFTLSTVESAWYVCALCVLVFFRWSLHNWITARAGRSYTALLCA